MSFPSLNQVNKWLPNIELWLHAKKKYRPRFSPDMQCSWADAIPLKLPILSRPNTGIRLSSGRVEETPGLVGGAAMTSGGCLRHPERLKDLIQSCEGCSVCKVSVHERVEFSSQYCWTSLSPSLSPLSPLPCSQSYSHLFTATRPTLQCLRALLQS